MKYTDVLFQTWETLLLSRDILRAAIIILV